MLIEPWNYLKSFGGGSINMNANLIGEKFNSRWEFTCKFCLYWSVLIHEALLTICQIYSCLMMYFLRYIIFEDDPTTKIRSSKQKCSNSGRAGVRHQTEDKVVRLVSGMQQKWLKSWILHWCENHAHTQGLGWAWIMLVFGLSNWTLGVFDRFTFIRFPHHLINLG